MRVVSLFSGAGGLDLGLERAGHEIVAMCEIDRIARSVLRRLLGGGPGDTRWYRRIDSASYRLAERSTSTLLARDALGRGADLVIDSRGPRDLDPVERERLMTWPDDWTSVDHSGSPLHPNHRYRLTGNGVVANLAEWVGRQLLT